MDEKQLAPLRIIYIAAIAGVSFFAVVALYVGLVLGSPKAPTDSNLRVVNIVSLTAGVLSIVLWKMAKQIFRRMMNPPTPGAAPAPGKIRGAFITRLAFYEAAAFLGLAAFLLAGLLGPLRQNGLYAALLTPYLTFLTVAVTTFPTVRSVRTLLDGLRG